MSDSSENKINGNKDTHNKQIANKESKTSKDNIDKFYLEKIYPNANELLNYSYPPIEEVADADDTVYVFDTNALLVPYLAGKNSINEIHKLLKLLKSDERLFFPARVVREFVKNRMGKLTEMYKQISQKRTQINNIINHFSISEFPNLEENKDFIIVQNKFREIKRLASESATHLKNLEDDITNLYINDPVSIMYQDIIVPGAIIEVEESRKKIEEDLAYRYTHQIPPGFKDATKPDGGIGDLIIWQTIKEIGIKKQCNIIFVSNEKKNDWLYVEEKTALFPRFELIEEFKRNVPGCSFFIIDFTEFLELRKATRKTIDAIYKHGEVERKRRELMRLEKISRNLSEEAGDLQNRSGNMGQDIVEYMFQGSEGFLLKQLERKHKEIRERKFRIENILDEINTEIKKLEEELRSYENSPNTDSDPT